MSDSPQIYFCRCLSSCFADMTTALSSFSKQKFNWKNKNVNRKQEFYRFYTNKEKYLLIEYFPLEDCRPIISINYIYILKNQVKKVRKKQQAKTETTKNKTEIICVLVLVF